MRNFYSLIFMASFGFSLNAQTSLSIASNTSSFYISDTNCEDVNPYDGIIWPCDFETINCNVLTDPTIVGEPIITSNNKSQIEISFEDIEYLAEENCRKIYRKWRVTDTRLYDQNSKKGSWEYIQKLKLIKSAPPIFISETKDQEFCIYNYDCSPDLLSLKAEAKDDCTARTEIKYYYEIDLNHNGKVDFRGNTNDASDIFPYGKHKIKWRATDGCGNIATCEYFFKVKDCKPPVSNCINGLMVELLPDKGEVIIEAKDFDQGSSDNCEVKEFRIVTPSKGEGQVIPPTRDSKSVTYNCASVGVNSVDFWVKDSGSNWSYCTTYVIVQANDVNCEELSLKEETLASKLDRFTEEIPLEIEKILVPDDEIVQTLDSGLKIFPTQPNPFEDKTKISFDLDQNTKMIFMIQDISGKRVKMIEKEFLAGYNEIILKKEDFEEAGIYFFTLKSKTHKATGKVILIQR